MTFMQVMTLGADAGTMLAGLAILPDLCSRSFGWHPSRGRGGESAMSGARYTVRVVVDVSGVLAVLGSAKGGCDQRGKRGAADGPGAGAGARAAVLRPGPTSVPASARGGSRSGSWSARPGGSNRARSQLSLWLRSSRQRPTRRCPPRTSGLPGRPPMR